MPNIYTSHVEHQPNFACNSFFHHMLHVLPPHATCPSNLTLVVDHNNAEEHLQIQNCEVTITKLFMI